jgi:hypothetical protein
MKNKKKKQPKYTKQIPIDVFIAFTEWAGKHDEKAYKNL